MLYYTQKERPNCESQKSSNPKIPICDQYTIHCQRRCAGGCFALRDVHEHPQLVWTRVSLWHAWGEYHRIDSYGPALYCLVRTHEWGSVARWRADRPARRVHDFFDLFPRNPELAGIGRPCSGRCECHFERHPLHRRMLDRHCARQNDIVSLRATNRKVFAACGLPLMCSTLSLRVCLRKNLERLPRSHERGYSRLFGLCCG